MVKRWGLKVTHTRVEI